MRLTHFYYKICAVRILLRQEGTQFWSPMLLANKTTGYNFFTTSLSDDARLSSLPTGGTIDSGSVPGSRRESVQSGFDFKEPPVSADGCTRRNSVAEYQVRNCLYYTTSGISAGIILHSLYRYIV